MPFNRRPARVHRPPGVSEITKDFYNNPEEEKTDQEKVEKEEKKSEELDKEE
jgi:hypothetical protein